MSTKPRLRVSAYPILAAIGAIAGTLWNQLHVQSSTLTFSHPAFANQAWWVPLLFAGAFAAGGALFTLAGDPAPRPPSIRVAQIEAVWMTAMYAMTAFLSEWPWLLAALLAAALLIRGGDMMVLFSSSPIPAVAVVAAGCFVESMLIAADLYRYRTSELGPIPVWLPLLWINVALLTVRVVEAMLLRFGVRRVVEPATSTVTPVDPPPETDTE